MYFGLLIIRRACLVGKQFSSKTVHFQFYGVWQTNIFYWNKFHMGWPYNPFKSTLEFQILTSPLINWIPVKVLQTSWLFYFRQPLLFHLLVCDCLIGHQCAERWKTHYFPWKPIPSDSVASNSITFYPFSMLAITPPLF